jgi:hypothetical protein
MIEDASYR